MMETYAERLQKEKEKTMTNYDMDQLRREGKVPDLEKRKEFAMEMIESEEDRNAFASVKIGEPKMESVEIEIPDEDLIKLALAAHDRDITLNQLCVDVLKSSFNDLDYRFEHGPLKPQVLKEY
tara:strand:+ start:373 stop:741 length:369 start_codon:yes stop_codon:yes gene_type:complete